MNMKTIHLQSNKDFEMEKFKLYCLIGTFLGCALIIDPSFAVTLDALKTPIDTLKKEIFGGWMLAVKIGAAATGIVLSAFRGSLAPFGIGAGLTLGIHLYDKYLDAAVSGALI